MSDLVKFAPVRGMRDFIGDDAAVYLFIVDFLRDIATRYGYNFLETPILESTSVFARGIGEETDIIGKEMFSFCDRSENSVSLRPEGTASVVRALISNKLTQTLPQKWFYYGPMFRYDRPQKGRYRQFYQFGLEYFGSYDHMSDVELIALVDDALRGLKIDGIQLKLNTVGDNETRSQYKSVLVEYLEKYEAELSPDSMRRLKTNPMRILDSKEQRDQEICGNAPKILDSLTPEARDFFNKVQEALSFLGITYEIDHTLVRGLDYYDHTTFEFKMKKPDEEGTIAVVGGGRYNGMVQQFGGPNIPAVGLAFGIDRLMLACGSAAGQKGQAIAVLNVDDADQNEAFKIAQELRQIGGVSVLFPHQDGITKKLRFCDKSGVSCVVIVGEAEIKKQEVTVKFLQQVKQFAASTEVVVRIDAISDFIHKAFL
ncbi:MAG: histidine--tRNA ligase [Holosporales bacterium]|jgi:histidyl-tRNA synthetase|nr:histidine--tRNA ligase [Holosporales bacterium]